MISSKRISAFVYIFFLLNLPLLNSCREDIVDPNNKGGNVNEPVSFNVPNSYTFIINANDVTRYVVDTASFQDSKTNLFVTLSNYKAGYVEIFVSNNRGISLYAKRFNTNQSNLMNELVGYVPYKVAINFYNFSGQLKVELISPY
jgi:hypothetical protein